MPCGLETWRKHSFLSWFLCRVRKKKKCRDVFENLCGSTWSPSCWIRWVPSFLDFPPLFFFGFNTALRCMDENQNTRINRKKKSKKKIGIWRKNRERNSKSIIYENFHSLNFFRHINQSRCIIQAKEQWSHCQQHPHHAPPEKRVYTNFYTH